MRRKKGHGKDPFWATILWLELLGPCRFGGWDDDGMPTAVEAAQPWGAEWPTRAERRILHDRKPAAPADVHVDEPPGAVGEERLTCPGSQLPRTSMT
ncbi:hypothetical protein [Streptomyces sp. NPDC055189]